MKVGKGAPKNGTGRPSLFGDDGDLGGETGKSWKIDTHRYRKCLDSEKGGEWELEETVVSRL